MKTLLSLRIYACLAIILAVLAPQGANALSLESGAEGSSNQLARAQSAMAEPADSDQSLAWFYECVSCPTQLDDMTNRSLHLDAGGYPHIVYGEFNLYHAWEDASGWHNEIVDGGGGVGHYTALDLDSSGFAYISYYDQANADLRFAYQDQSGWHILVIDSDGSVGEHTSLALDANRYAHISYYDKTNGDLKLAHQDEGGWQLVVLDNVGDVGQYTSLTMDSSGYAHISYYDKTNADLRYIFEDQAGWHPYIVVSQNSVGMYSSLALDSQGHRHISFYNDTSSSLSYMEFDITQASLSRLKDLTIQAMDMTAPNALDAVGRYTTIAVDQDDRVHIVYSTYQCMMWSGNDCWSDEPRNLMYTHDDGSAPPWPTQTAGYIGEHASLALDPTGKPRVSYLNEKFGNLVYTQSNGISWTSKTIEKGGAAGLYPSLALDLTGYARISYFDGVSDYLQYAAQSSNGWSIETVQTSGNPSTIAWGSGYTSLVLDGSQNPHISYYTGEGQQVLHYTYQDQAGWHILTADTGNAGNYSSLELDSSGYARISYYKGAIYGSSVKYDLKYVYQDAAGWHPAYVDQPGDVGEYTSLELDTFGRPYISYYTLTNGNLKLAYLDGVGTWQFVIVDSAGDVGQYTSLDLDANNYPHISYYDKTNGDLRYAFQDSSGWYTNTVDSQGDVGLYTSLRLDQNGFAHVSYYDKTNCDLKYAFQDQAGWHTETVDDGGDVGWYTSLALDQNGRAHITYHDYGNKGLLYAYIGEATYGVSLTPSTGDKTGSPGDSVVYTLQVTNNGNARDTYDVSLDAPVWATSSPAEIGPLNPGASGSLPIIVEIPPGAALGQTDTAVVTVTSLGDNTKSASAVLTTTAAKMLNLPLVMK